MIDFELLRAEAARHPYLVLFATISGAHLYGFRLRIPITTCAARISCQYEGLWVSFQSGRP
jgi:hypothetical protein